MHVPVCGVVFPMTCTKLELTTDKYFSIASMYFFSFNFGKCLNQLPLLCVDICFISFLGLLTLVNHFILSLNNVAPKPYCKECHKFAWFAPAGPISASVCLPHHLACNLATFAKAGFNFSKGCMEKGVKLS